jgi:hypothetical protein
MRVSHSFLMHCRPNLDLSLLNIFLQLFESRSGGYGPPRRDTRIKHHIHLLQRFSLPLVSLEKNKNSTSGDEYLCLRRGQEHVNQRRAIEGAKDHIHLPINSPQQRGHCKSKPTVPGPITRRRQRDRLRTHFMREHLRGHGPRYGSPGSCEGRHEQIGACGDSPGLGGLVDHFPGDCSGGIGFWFAVGPLDRAGDEEPGHHEETAEEQCWPPTEFVDVDDRRDSHYDVDDVLDGGGEEGVVDTCSLHDIYNVVHLSAVRTTTTGGDGRKFTMMFIPVSWLHICIDIPKMTRFTVRGFVSSVKELIASSRSNRIASSISLYSASTFGFCRSPPP